MSEDKSKLFRDHTTDENRAYDKFIDSYFNVIQFPDKEAEARLRSIRRLLKRAKMFNW